MRKLWPTQSQRGDTIVEVMIAMAVASVVLAGAYALTNRNLSITQSTNERSQALQLVQKQIELMRAASANWVASHPPSLPFTLGGNCLDDSANPSNSCNVSPGTSNVDASADCSSYCYKVDISTETGVPGATVYQVQVTWPSQDGTTSSISVDYGPTS
jgi:prepilin-type N-terminal cleavage/methylation domain-containing protein